MAQRKVETAVSISIDRNLPATAYGDLVKAIHASGTVDYLTMWDQLTSWIPPCLWTPENTPLHAVVPDLDSYPDWNVMCGYAAALAPGLGTAISMDAIRRGPADLTQTMLTVANCTQGKSIYSVGAGEIKQCQPFGYKRSEGLARLEDFYRIFHAFWEAKAPIDVQGHHWKMDQAWLGVARHHRPRIWGLGGGPKILDLATTYADGFSTMCPMVWTTPEHTAEQIGAMKQQLAEKGRDPEAFDFGIWVAAVLHEDEAMIERAFDNPLVKWSTCVMGRIIQSDWLREGIEPPMPPDWHYAMKMLPQKIDLAQANQMLSGVTSEMSHKSWIYGSPQTVAKKLQPYIHAGVTWVLVLDMMPILLPVDQAPQALARSLEVCRLLKQ